MIGFKYLIEFNYYEHTETFPRMLTDITAMLTKNYV